jgi:hypothetical protein
MMAASVPASAAQHSGTVPARYCAAVALLVCTEPEQRKTLAPLADRPAVRLHPIDVVKCCDKHLDPKRRQFDITINLHLQLYEQYNPGNEYNHAQYPQSHDGSGQTLGRVKRLCRAFQASSPWASASLPPHLDL